MTHLAFPWLRFSMEVATLGVEAQSVVGLRMISMASGDSAAGREVLRMVPEKLAAFAEAQIEVLDSVVDGALHRPPTSAVASYLRRVRDNRRRLTRV
jgi:hypothetical protein